MLGTKKHKVKTIAERSASIKQSFISSIKELEVINNDAIAEKAINESQIEVLQKANSNLEASIELNSKFKNKLEDLIS